MCRSGKASLPAVEPRLPARRREGQISWSTLTGLEPRSCFTLFPGSKDAALHVRQRCLTPLRIDAFQLPQLLYCRLCVGYAALSALLGEIFLNQKVGRGTG